MAAKVKYSKGIISRGNVYKVDLDFIEEKENFNPRVDYGDVSVLAESIKNEGLLQPLRLKRVGRDKLLQIVDGHRRYRAIKSLNKKLFKEGIPAFIEVGQFDNQTLIHSVIYNTGKTLSPLEEAEAFVRLVKQGVVVREIARRIGHSDMYVFNRMAILNAHPVLLKAVQQNKIPISNAVEIIKATKDDLGEQLKLTKEALKGKQGKKSVKSKIKAKQEKKNTTRRERINERSADMFRVLGWCHKEL